MKKFFTLCAALMASFGLFAATESHPSEATKDVDVVGISYTIPSTYIAGIGGTKAGDMQSKGIKFRLGNKVDGNAKGFCFNVTEGYKITKLEFCGHVNDNSKTSTLADVKVDGVSVNFTPVELPTKTSSLSFALDGFEALESVILVFEGTGTQANLEYTVTYEEAVQKEVDQVNVTLAGVAVNGEALSDPDLATLNNAHTLNLTDEYVEAPTFTFTIQTDTYYKGETEPNTKRENVDIIAEEVSGSWQAQIVVGENDTYTITAVKPATVTVTYKDGEAVLGTEAVKKGETAQDFVQYQVKPLSDFLGWFLDAELSDPVDMANYVVNADLTVYAKFDKAYATSLNVEQFVLDNGTKADIKSVLTLKGYDYNNIDQLDTLNDDPSKTNRNYPFLGLKLKKADAYVGFNLKQGSSAHIRFGNVGADFKLILNGEEQVLTNAVANISVESENEEEIVAKDADVYVRILCNSTKTLVIKQIMIDEEIEAVVLPAAPTTAIDNAAISGKAVKVIRNGQVVILRDGKTFDVLGTEIK